MIMVSKLKKYIILLFEFCFYYRFLVFSVYCLKEVLFIIKRKIEF